MKQDSEAKRLRDLDRHLGELIDKRDLLELQEKAYEHHVADLEKQYSNGFIIRYQRDVLYEDYINKLRLLGESMRALDREIQLVRSDAAEIMSQIKDKQEPSA
jgi:hypothetical protein